MKKIWSQYSFAILLICLSFVLAFVLSGKSQTSINDDYLSVKVEEGDSLWGLSQMYEHDMSSKQFINWVKKNNKIDEDIIVGQSIILPVKKEDLLIASGESHE